MKFLSILLSVILLGSHSYAQDIASQRDGKVLKIRVMSYNLRFGELASLEEMANHIKAFKPDFVALQEVDCNTHRERAPHQHDKNFINELAYHTGLFGLYGKTIDYSEGYYGIGILSRYPYISVTKTLLPHLEKEYEQRIILEGLFDVDGDTIVFASTHLDAKSEVTRVLQAKTISEHFAGQPNPVIIGGDFNAAASSEVIGQMKKYWFFDPCDQPSIPSWKPIRRIDFVFAKPMDGWKVVRSQSVYSCLSDHLPVIVDLEYRIPSH